MKLLLTGATIALGMMCAMANAQEKKEGPQAEVPVKAVVLYSSGVGYFEHFGLIKGDGSTELRFKTAQINDILKSLVLQDLDGGKVSAVTYPSQDPIEKTLKSFQVNITGNPSLVDLLSQLRGAKVTATIGAEKVEGVVLGTEKRPMVTQQGSPPVDVWFVNILSGASIKQIDVGKLSDVTLQDAALQDELNRALTALSKSRDQDKKPVSIAFMGQGDRRVRIGYVVETPVWKTSYRLILDEQAPKEGDKGKGAKLQGWAIVENQTDNDWTDVQLSLVSGRPISFVQDLYQPMYIPRPVVQPEIYASLKPQEYAGGMEQAKESRAFGGAGGRAMQQMAKRAAPAPSAAPMVASEMGESALMDRMDVGASVQSVASASKVGELFQYTVGSVSLARQRSAMIPIITDEIEVEKVSIYNAGVMPRNPLNGARVKNTTDKHLLAGPITVLENSAYAGDARIDNVPPKQERLLSYGIDLQMLVDSTSNKQEAFLQTGKIVKGVLELSRKHVFTQDYVADNKSDKVRTLIVEHPFRVGWKLVDTIEPMEKTDTLYRFKGKVEPTKNSKLTVKEELIQSESLAILPCDIGQLDFYSRTGEIPQNVRDALAKAIGLKQKMVDTQRQIQQRQQRAAEITQEQNRIRENMKTVDKASQYSNRLLGKLNDQESALEKIQGEIEELQKQYNAQQKDLETYLGELNVG